MLFSEISMPYIYFSKISVYESLKVLFKYIAQDIKNEPQPQEGSQILPIGLLPKT